MGNNLQNENNLIEKAWWKEAVVYQIYPRSFKDSNGDGIGDLQGIISKLEYIESLGVDVVWLNPIFSSPNDDNGYDISDYQNIMQEFGAMSDFDQLLQGLHQRGIKLILDLVANHSSDEHAWFKESRSSRDNPYRDFYHWWPAEKGTPPKRYSFFDVANNAWKYDARTNAYYLHYFSEKQPDLNWENPLLRNEIYKMMRFWFDKGIDGFRMDVIPFISKDTAFPDLPARYNGNFVHYYSEGPYLHKYLREMNEQVLSKYNCMTVAEGIGVGTDAALNFVDEERKELTMLYHFEGIGLGLLHDEFKAADPNGYDLVAFKDLYSRWDAVFADKGWGTIYLGNHDNPRMLTRWGNDTAQFWQVSSKMLTTFLLTMRGTPYYYFGDELGMSNIKFTNIDDYRDIESINMYKQIEEHGGNLQRFMDNQKVTARDNGRTPFQWGNAAHAGFTDAEPWLRVNPNYTHINAAIQEQDPHSVLTYFKRLVRLRKSEPALIYGNYTLIDRENPHSYSYTRQLDGKCLLISLNFTAADTHWPIADCENTPVLFSNYPQEATATGILRPYEAIVALLK